MNRLNIIFLSLLINLRKTLKSISFQQRPGRSFSGSGPNQSIQELERRILTEWLPTSGYEYGNGADVEVYINPDPENAQYEIWIPVVQKQN